MARLLLLAALVVGVAADSWIWAEPRGGAPSPRFQHTSNRIGSKLWVVGGKTVNKQTRADTHILDTDTMRWSPANAKGEVPSIKMGHSSVVYGDDLIIMFGTDGLQMSNKIYKLDTSGNSPLGYTWARVYAEGRIPNARAYQSAHLVGDKVYTFGGFDGQFYLNDLSMWSLKAGAKAVGDANASNATNATGKSGLSGHWVKLNQTGTVPEVRASAATAVYGNQMFLFGGFEVAVYKNDFYVLDMVSMNWSPVHLSDTSCPMPGARAMATLTLVSTRLVLYGGVWCGSNGTCVPQEDVHQFDIFKSSFNTTEPNGLLPPARNGHTGTLVGAKVMVFGGANWPNMFNDVSTYDVYENLWEQAPGLPPYARKQHTMNPGVVDDTPMLVVFGGKHGVSSAMSSDVHMYNLESGEWSHPPKEPYRINPQAMAHHAAAIKDNNTLVIFGGYNGTHSSNEVWSADMTKESVAWEKVDADGFLPPPCHGHAVVTGNNEWLQFGGVDCNDEACTFYNEMHSLGMEALSWQKVRSAGAAPGPRASHSWTTVGDGLHVLFGGIGEMFSNKNDVFTYDSVLQRWTFIDVRGAKPAARFGHTAVGYRGRLLVYGGGSCRSVGDCTYFSDVSQLVLETRTWAAVTVNGATPAARLGAASVMLGEFMYTLGGATDERVFSDMNLIRPAYTEPTSSISFGMGKRTGTAGSNILFMVQNQDVLQVNRTTGLDEIVCTATPTSTKATGRLALLNYSLAPAVTDMHNGQYKVEWSSPVTDEYTLQLTINGVSLEPWKSKVVADDAAWNMTLSSGGGRKKCIAGMQCKINLEFFDLYGNRVDRKVPLVTTFKGPRRPEKKVVDSGEGSAVLFYTPEKSGLYQARVALKADQVTGSPFNITVSPADASPKKSRVGGDGLQTAMAGDLGQVTLMLHDEYDNPLWVGGDDVRGGLTGTDVATKPEQLACNVVDNGDGTYNLSYTAVVAGEYSLSLAVNGEMVEGFPMMVVVRPTDTNPATTYAWGAGLKTCQCGLKSYFKVQATDSFGNNVTTGGSQLNVLFAGAGDFKVMADVVDGNDGKYTVSYTSKRAGDFMISATMFTEAGGFQSLHLSPFLGTCVPGSADPTQTRIFLDDKNGIPEGTELSGVAGIHQYFKIQAVDKYGNMKQTGGDRFAVELEGPTAQTGYISDNGDGTYSGGFAPPMAGKFYLKVFYGGVPIKGTPIPVMVRQSWDECPNACSFRGQCKSNVCICERGYAGDDCSIKTGDCPSNCFGQGACVNNTCVCYPGFDGEDCSLSTTLCLNDCSKHGECVDAQCVCDEAYTGPDCADNSLTCPDQCMGNGECVDGICLCFPGYKGSNCATKFSICPNKCSGRGNCMDNGMCACSAGWGGVDCSSQLIDMTGAAALIHSRQHRPVNFHEGPRGPPEKLPAKLARRKLPTAIMGTMDEDMARKEAAAAAAAAAAAH